MWVVFVCCWVLLASFCVYSCVCAVRTAEVFVGAKKLRNGVQTTPILMVQCNFSQHGRGARRHHIAVLYIPYTHTPTHKSERCSAHTNVSSTSTFPLRPHRTRRVGRPLNVKYLFPENTFGGPLLKAPQRRRRRRGSALSFSASFMCD